MVLIVEKRLSLKIRVFLVEIELFLKQGPIGGFLAKKGFFNRKNL
jgi:hypothetical protein